jgi:PD-(D/E)XK nuclease superfamily
MVQQMTLFDREITQPPSEAASKVTQIEWSHSRRDLFERCLFWYYGSYYGARKGTAKLEPRKEQLRFLKNLGNVNLRTGNIMHLVIRTCLQHSKKGSRWTVERALSWAQEIYNQDLDFSRKYKSDTPLPSGNNAPVLLMEFFYGFANADHLWEETAARLRKALINFFTNPEFERFHRGAMHQNSLIEKPIRLKDRHFNLRGQIDLAYPEDERQVVLDWKIGVADGDSSDSLQLLSYALAAIDELGCAPEAIDLYKVHLGDGDGKIAAYTIRDHQIRNARIRIIQDTERMRSMDRYGRDGVSGAFTPCGQPRVCRMCPFQALCPKGAQIDVGD